MGRLIHYSDKPLTEVRSVPHCEHGSGVYKTPGLWVSVEGDDDWPSWCKAENFGLERLAFATQVILKEDAKILHISSASGLDDFTETFKKKDNTGFALHSMIDWPAVRANYQGIIIAPYCWQRRLEHMWYYGWDAAAGILWDAAAVKDLRILVPEQAPHVIDLPDPLKSG